MRNLSHLGHLPHHKSQQRMSIRNVNMNIRHVFRTLSRLASNCILIRQVLHFPATLWIVSSMTVWYFVALVSHYSVKLRTILSLIYFSLHSPTSLHPKLNLQPARWGIMIHRKIKQPTFREHLHMHCRRPPIFIAEQMFELSTQPSSIV
jgi:hypothetical protein